jgi:hypothetical protein
MVAMVMIKDILDPAFVFRKSAAIQRILSRESLLLEASDRLAQQRAQKRAVSLADIQAALFALEQAQSTEQEEQDLTWIPRDPRLSLLQSALTEIYLKIGATDQPLSEGFIASGQFVPVTNVSLRPEFAAPVEEEAYDNYGERDPAFAVGYALARAYAMRKGTIRFPENPPTVKIEDKARIVLFGDWGSGLPRAQDLSDSISDLISKAPDRDCHVIHLGDVYYAGFEKEYVENVLPHWPVKAGEPYGSWSLNGNHDMYTGGHTFFETLLGNPRFKKQEGSSYFCLYNKYWQILGLDTSYDAPDWRGDKAGLYGDQAGWVTRNREAAPEKGGILLSHHQLFSPWEGHSEVLFRKLGPILSKKLVRAWFWGHEHRCAIYHPMHQIDYPCLLGHAGVPVRYKKPDDHSAVRWEWDDKIDYEEHSYTTLGAVVLDFTDKVLEISFYNERGQPIDTHQHERLQVD